LLRAHHNNIVVFGNAKYAKLDESVMLETKIAESMPVSSIVKEDAQRISCQTAIASVGLHLA
jgi:hypothetical protein